MIDNHLKDGTPCSASQHIEFRSLLGSLNWLQSRTQLAVCYNFSRAAAAAAAAAAASAAPEVGDKRGLNKIVRAIRAKPQRVMFHPPKGSLRLVGYPDASCRNSSDTS